MNVYGKILDEKNIKINEPMKNHTSFKIGGPADFFITLKNIEELKKVKELADLENIPFLVIGNGSNLLVRDKGIRGIVAKLAFNNLEIIDNTVKVSADYTVSKLSRKCAKLKLSGIEFLARNTWNYWWSC
jgi:UDP-N-acetylmuramate dehydrogenase